MLEATFVLKLDDHVYVAVVLMWVIAAWLLLDVIFDIRPAYAEPACGDRSIILEDRSKLYSERPQAIALSADGKVIDILVSPSGSWSIPVIHPNHQTCVVAIGESWLSLPAVATESLYLRHPASVRQTGLGYKRGIP